MFISFEGIDGSGKSTQVALAADALRRAGHDVVVTKEPKGEIRTLLVEGGADRWSPLSELLLHYAARQEHLLHEVRPALARGAVVLCDRFVDSTIAYQCGGHGLNAEALVENLKLEIIGETMPELTILCDVGVEEALARAGKRPGNETRYEGFGVEYMQRVRERFLQLAAADPARIRKVDAGQAVNMVHAAVIAVMNQSYGLQLSGNKND